MDRQEKALVLAASLVILASFSLFAFSLTPAAAEFRPADAGARFAADHDAAAECAAHAAAAKRTNATEQA